MVISKPVTQFQELRNPVLYHNCTANVQRRKIGVESRFFTPEAGSKGEEVQQSKLEVVGSGSPQFKLTTQLNSRFLVRVNFNFPNLNLTRVGAHLNSNQHVSDQPGSRLERLIRSHPGHVRVAANQNPNLDHTTSYRLELNLNLTHKE